ncbi:uncharacterized protein LOC111703123 isoform X2 [Eurytemora carolleeae]|uniref:uncharacterized protein LOC111703123 isoform X2 n=1 Tax=Eurytemora carolleeae TaxID=1294199 RepID=UPI000C789079|nr:uncharacterized protein LOC111703123 isoform X2 [Eurytemora carolleeae]|eukprot:XP_023330756.1 uncharacterized protein LOC111703123 isoform X2 [Eurytemora affinis]
MIKDVVFEKLKSIRDLNVNEIPSRIWRHQERDEVCAIFSTSVIKGEKTLFSIQTGKIVFSTVFNDLIYIIVKTGKRWTIYRIESGVAVDRPTKVFECEEEIKWILVLKGDQIKPIIFAENNLKSDFTTDEFYVFVGGQSPCLVFRDVSYKLHPFPATPLSKPEFIIKYTQSPPSLKVEKFAQILDLLEPQGHNQFYYLNI